MMDCEHRMLSFFSDINSFYNDCMMYDNLKNMLKEVCVEYYKKGYEDCKTDAIDVANKEGYISVVELLKLRFVNPQESEGL